MEITRLHMHVLNDYYSPYLGLNMERLAAKNNVSVDEIEDVIYNLIKKGLLAKKELKSKALGNYDKPSVEIIVITIRGKLFWESNNIK